MRDINRIPGILKELEQIWKANPDLRLGQLIVNATRPKDPCPSVFFIEDEDLVKGIRGIGKPRALNETKRIPYWEIYPEIISIELEQLTPELIKQFIEAIKKEQPNLIITPRSMMQLIGAPISDHGWMNKQKRRVEKLKRILAQLQEAGEIENVEVGYKA